MNFTTTSSFFARLSFYCSLFAPQGQRKYRLVSRLMPLHEPSVRVLLEFPMGLNAKLAKIALVLQVTFRLKGEWCGSITVDMTSLEE